MNEKCTLYLVVPCYNEQEVLTETNRQLLEKMTSLMERSMKKAGSFMSMTVPKIRRGY